MIWSVEYEEPAGPVFIKSHDMIDISAVAYGPVAHGLFILRERVDPLYDINAKGSIRIVITAPKIDNGVMMLNRRSSLILHEGSFVQPPSLEYSYSFDIPFLEKNRKNTWNITRQTENDKKIGVRRFHPARTRFLEKSEMEIVREMLKNR